MKVSVVLSSCEAEIMAASEAAKEALFLSRFLDELGHGSSEPVEMGMDNQAAIAISYNPELLTSCTLEPNTSIVVTSSSGSASRTCSYEYPNNLADFSSRSLLLRTTSSACEMF